MKKIIFTLIIAGIIALMPHSAVFSMEAPGNILFQFNGQLSTIQSDGRGGKTVSVGANTPAYVSPDGKKIVYFNENGIFLITDIKEKGKLINDSRKGEIPCFLGWNQESNGFFFRRTNQDKSVSIFAMDLDKNSLRDLGSFQEIPKISPSGKYWVYSANKPETSESEVYGGLIGEKGRYIFDGHISNILCWDMVQDAIIYSVSDKIYGYSLEDRSRQIIPLPFKDVSVISFGASEILYKNRDQENNMPGLHIFDPETNEQKTLDDKKGIAVEVTHNMDRSKFVIFAPSKSNNLMGEGDLYLVESRDAKVTKLTKDSGNRIFNVINMNYQWSPDGKYFVYEKLKLSGQKAKKSELYIVGEGKNEVLLKSKKTSFNYFSNPTWGELK